MTLTVVSTKITGRPSTSSLAVICLSDDVKCQNGQHKFSFNFDHQRRPGQSLCKRFMKLRFQLCLFLFFSMYCMMFVNSSLNVTLLCMTSNESCYSGNLSSHSVGEHILNWTLAEQSLVMSAMSWGRLFAPVAGLLVDKFDNGHLLEISFMVAGLTTSILPYASFNSFPIVCALRTITGIADAVIQPCTTKFVAQWYSEKTRTSAFGWATAGRQLGSLVVYPLSGLLCTQVKLLGGWPIVFYLAGLCCCLWTMMFHIFKVLRLRKRQKMIQQSSKCDIPVVKGSLPWKDVLQSVPVWTNIGAILCHEIPLNLLFAFLPRYIRDVMKMDILSSSLLSTIPVASFLVSKIVSSQLDHVIKCKFPQVTPTLLAKIFNGLACLGLGTFLLCASFLNTYSVVVIMICLCLCTASAGLHTPGCLGTLVTMAPNYTGSLSGFAYFFISLSSILSPLVVAKIVVNESASEWSVVFQGASAVALLPLVFFTLWGSTEEQTWCKNVSPTQSTVNICNVESPKSFKC